MFQPLTIRANPAEKFYVGNGDIELESGDSTLTYTRGKFQFSTDVGSHTYNVDVDEDGNPLASNRSRHGGLVHEVRERLSRMWARFREHVAKSPEALRTLTLAGYMKLAARTNPSFEIPRWVFWAAGGAIGAAVLLATSNAGAAPYPSVRNPTVLYRDEYDTLFSTCIVTPSRLAEVDRIIERIKTNRSRYEQVQNATQVPWWWIAAVHNLEAGLDFTTHLHNGDPLTARTVHVPAGRPVAGEPPFTWEESALDALAYDHVSGWHDWTVGGALYKLEAYNGWGYRRYGVNSPYLWSFSNQYVKGKFVRDGVWDPNAVSEQCGGGTLWRRMVDLGLIRIET